MNELYTRTELIHGRWYRYDPDRDIWYPMTNDESPAGKWAWVTVTVLLCAIAYWAEYLR